MNNVTEILFELLKPWNIIRRIKRTQEAVWALSEELGNSRRDQLFLAGQIAARDMPKDLPSIRAAEFRVFSQFGEDGIIQYLAKRLEGKIDQSFVEFGVQTYLESNTLFLLMNNGWRGLVMDSQQSYIDDIEKREFRWKYGLKARCAFITRDNINAIFQEEGFGLELGLLSIDVDSTDWHLWDALTVVRPGIVVVEYNQIFPNDRPVTIPYSTDFDRKKAHYTTWYFGTSLAALVELAKQKGYAFVGVESHRRNAFFVREDLAHLCPADELRASYVVGTQSDMDNLRGLPVFNAATRTEEVL